jgi:ATP-binding cassette subfamily C (CFTR/MRP) protein 5
MERNQKLFYHLWMSMSWVTARLEIASTVVVLAVSILAVCLRASVSPTALGLALAYALQLTALFQRSVQLLIDVSTYFTSTERMYEYLDITQEQSVSKDPPLTHSDPSRVPAKKEGWQPQSGSIEFVDVWMHYRNNPPILKGISFKVQSGERIGVCGRTGAGKVSTKQWVLTVGISVRSLESSWHSPVPLFSPCPCSRTLRACLIK